MCSQAFPAAAPSVRVEHVDRIVPAACGLTLVVKKVPRTTCSALALRASKQRVS